jgi:FkbM family methyltransferase
MKCSPAVSVVMSVYNGQAFLAAAIESILSQTFRDFEFLIIDDGSSDKTPEILSTCAKQDGRIRVVRHENKGRAVSLNIGIELSKSPYIARMDADDISLPNRIKEQLEFMERHPEVGLLSGTYERINSEGRVLDTIRLLPRDAEIKVAMLVYNPMCHPAAMMRREVAIACGEYRKAFLDADDYDLWLRMSERSQLANLEQPILQYRVHSNQVSFVNSSHQSLCVLAARTAAAFRKQGRPDPLSGVEQITPELLRNLGVTTAEIQDCLRTNYKNSVKVGSSNSGTVLRLLEPMRGAFRVRFWHPLLNLTRPIRHALGLRQKSAKATEPLGARPLVFDVGANTGAKTQQYLTNGARVVCFEPQSVCVDALRQRFRGNERVVVVPTALGANIGEAEMAICTGANTISTLANGWKTGRFKDYKWDRAEIVPVTTLDAAIDQYGMPFYCKIDVEGFEQSVLSGLTRQIPVLSFEFCAEGLDQTQTCLDLLSRLGYSAFNACLGETIGYVLPAEVSAGELMDHLRNMSDPLAWGDVYAAVGLRIPDSRLLPKLLSS